MRNGVKMLNCSPYGQEKTFFCENAPSSYFDYYIQGDKTQYKVSAVSYFITNCVMLKV